MPTVKDKLTVAALQVSPVFLNKKETVAKYCAWIEKAGQMGVDLVVTPETGIPTYPYWRQGFGYTDPETAVAWRETVIDYYENSVRIPSPETDALCRAAKKANTNCVIGISEQDDRPGSATLFNTFLYISRNGDIIGRHRKLIPTYQERFFWGSGDASDLRVFDTDIGRLGGLVCYENHVTLFKAAMAALGEEIHVAAWPGYWSYGGQTRAVRDMSGKLGPLHTCDQDSALREYAFETQTFVVSCGLYLPPDGIPDSFPFKSKTNAAWAVGGSCIVNPFGQYLVEPVFNQETIVAAEIDLRDRILAKNVLDCMGHYARWDVVSLNLRRDGWTPVPGNGLASGVTPDLLAQVAEKHRLSPEKVEAIARELGLVG